MKSVLLFLLALSLSNQINAQLSYSDLEDLNIICKRENFDAAKTFLVNEGYTIEKFITNYDHGSYKVLAEISASKKLGKTKINHYYTDSYGYKHPIDDATDIEDGIYITCEDYDDKKTLSIAQSIYTDEYFHIKFRKMAPAYNWFDKKWTRCYIGSGYNDWYYQIGGQSVDNLYYTDDTLNNLLLKNHFLAKRFEDNDDFVVKVENRSQSLWLDNTLAYFYNEVTKNYQYAINLETLYWKVPIDENDTQKPDTNNRNKSRKSKQAKSYSVPKKKSSSGKKYS